MKIELQLNEVTIDTWSINYLPPAGGKATGKLSITNQRLLFLPLHDRASFALSIYSKKGRVILNKAEIKKVDVQKSFFLRK